MRRLQPTTPEDAQLMVKSESSLLPSGGGTKSTLSTADNGTTQLDMSQLSGIIEYEPGEYTFTAYAGTPLQQIVDTLAAEGQYLPFDPLLVKKGATLGGTIAANTGGSGRYRYGGARDFIIGLHFIDGQGQLVRSGGKVVKNAAGFDLPKFMVGSMGRYGVFVDVSFKVFPAPRSYTTLLATAPSLDAALQASFKLAVKPFEIDALDFEPAENKLLLRLGGLAEALPGRIERLQNFLDSETELTAAEIISDEAETTLWHNITEAAWVGDDLNLVKVPLPPKGIPALEEALAGETPRRYTAGGNVAWLGVSSVDELSEILTRLGLAGLVLFGPSKPAHPIIGLRKGLSLAQRVKQALDPAGKFLAA